MPDSFLAWILESEWRVFLVVAAVLLVGTELGFRIGRHHTPERRQLHQGQSRTLQGALLGLLGLLLGFTFAMAVGRFETRKQLVLDEANAIGTSWLRAGFLDDQGRETVRASLMDYIDARLEAAELAPGSDELKSELARSEQHQATIWRTMVAAVRTQDSPSKALLAVALNDLIDLDAKRQAASRNHVPRSVWLLLMLVSFTVCGTTGYATGLDASGRLALAMVVLPILVTVVITIITDLDNPRRGLIQVSQQSMVDLQQNLRKY